MVGDDPEDIADTLAGEDDESIGVRWDVLIDNHTEAASHAHNLGTMFADLDAIADDGLKFLDREQSKNLYEAMELISDLKVWMDEVEDALEAELEELHDERE